MQIKDFTLYTQLIAIKYSVLFLPLTPAIAPKPPNSATPKAPFQNEYWSLLVSSITVYDKM